MEKRVKKGNYTFEFKDNDLYIRGISGYKKVVSIYDSKGKKVASKLVNGSLVSYTENDFYDDIEYFLKWGKLS